MILVERDSERLLSHSQNLRIGQALQQVMPGLASVYAQIKEGGEGWDRYEEGRDKWMISYVNIDALDWTVAVLTRPTLFSGSVRRAGLLNLAITFVSVLLIVVLIPLVINCLTGSISRVARGAEAIAAGDLDQQIEVVTHDRETRSLAASFNYMADSLKSTLGDFQQLNEELEERVGRRTADLEEANRTVQQQNLLLVRERAAHRIRSEALSMGASDDMLEVVARMWRELKYPGAAVHGQFGGVPRRGERPRHRLLCH